MQTRFLHRHFVAAGCFLIAAACLASEFDDPKLDDELCQVGSTFVSLHIEGRLPGLAPSEKRGRDSVFKIKAQDWVKWLQPFVSEIKRCDNLFMVDADTPQKRLKYFFCQKTTELELTGVYELNGDTWVRIWPLRN